MQPMFRSFVAATISVGAVALVATMVPAAASPNLVVNGSFEADSFNTGGQGIRLGLIGNDVTGWYIPNGDGTYPWGLQNSNIYNAGPADTGNQWLVLGEWGPMDQFTIQQTVAGLTPGATYTMTWAAASEQGCCSNGQLSFLSGSSTGPDSFTAPSSGSYWTQWGHYSYSFVANASSVTFQFQDILPTTNGYDLGLDSVTMTGSTVPEPATWALMLLGFAGLAFAGYRKAKGAAAFAA
jgi:Protein of unknown function (DUF642)/PEP-CTERM motif